ncbi:MAG: HlyD family efflux transporter periplasmic adaptor subunit [Phycisphaeraceae bacterium]
MMRFEQLSVMSVMALACLIAISSLAIADEAKPNQSEKKDTVAAPAAPDKPKADEKKADEKKADDKPADKPEDKKEEAKKPEPATHVVKKDEFKISLNLTGVFESKSVRSIDLRPQFWQAWVLSKAAAHGKLVKKGDVLVQFDSKAIDDAIHDYEASRSLADLEYQAAQEQLSMMEETVPLDLANAERNKDYFDQDYKRYLDLEVPMSRRLAEQNLMQVQNFLAYEKEELKQLEKMYKADDLTEETEEIILKRQRDQVARIEFMFERAKQTFEQTTAVMLPREELQVKNNEKISEIRLRVARQQLPRMLIQQRLAVQKMTRDREKSLENYKKLKSDRALMTIKAPIDGYVYYGSDTRGQFTQVAALTGMLQEGQPIKPGTTLMTIVAPRPLAVRTTISEATLGFAKPGIAGKAKPTAFSDLALDAKLESVSLVPLAPGQFDAVVAITPAKGDESVMPGMNCAIKLTAYVKKDAITIPPATIHADEDDDDRKFVYLLEKDGKNRKVEVKTGKSVGTKTEILAGLKEGDKVLLQKP